MNARNTTGKRVSLRLLVSCEGLAEDCRENWETECSCPLHDVFECPFFGVNRKCFSIEPADWERICMEESSDD